jgi:hypothetical protein
MVRCVLHTSITDLILIEDFFSFPWNYDVIYGHVLRASNFTSEWRTASKIISKFNIDAVSSWWKSQTMRGVHSSWIDPLKLGIIAFFRTFAPWWFCGKSTPLLLMNLKLYVKVVTRLKTPLSSHGFQFLGLDTIIGFVIGFVDYLLIAKWTT